MFRSHPSEARLFIPDAEGREAALRRSTHLGIGAHQDDLEFMALHGILECFQRPDRWFGGITCTDGAGSARSGPYADFSDAAMREIRALEQEKAASIGGYGFMAQLGYSSKFLKTASTRGLVADALAGWIREVRPEVIYTHNPFDKHATHIGVFRAVLDALLQFPPEFRPKRLIGCEVWRSLDWLPDALKVVHDVSAHPNLAAALNGVFDSQISGGKRYDLAVEGRRLANATFFDSHSVDHANRVAFGIDLTALIRVDGPPLKTFLADVLDQFQGEIRDGLNGTD